MSKLGPSAAERSYRARCGLVCRVVWRWWGESLRLSSEAREAGAWGAVLEYDRLSSYLRSRALELEQASERGRLPGGGEGVLGLPSCCVDAAPPLQAVLAPLPAASSAACSSDVVSGRQLLLPWG